MATDAPMTPLDDTYNRGVEDYRKEQDERRDYQRSLTPNHSPAQRSNSPGRRRSRSRSPLRRRSRSRSRSPRRHRDNRSGGGYRNGSNIGRTVRDKSCRVYVSNLNYDTKWMNLKDFMKKIGAVEHVEIFTDGEGRSKGCGVVEFSHSDDAAQAIKELDGGELAGRKLRLREDIMDDTTYKEQLKTQKDKSQAIKHRENDRLALSQNTSSLGLNLGGGLGGLSALFGAQNHQLQILTMLNSKGGESINSSVFVSNLDYELTWQKLKDLFRKVGNCVRVDIAQGEDNRSKGFGSVVFETPMEALSAIAMFNGTEVGPHRRQMSVRLDRSASLHQLLGQLGINSNDINQKTLIQLQSLATVAMLGVGSLGGGLAGLGGLGGALGGLSAALGTAASGTGYGGLQAGQTSVANQSLAGLSSLQSSLSGLSSLINGVGLSGSGLSSLGNYGTSGGTGSYGISTSSYGQSGNTGGDNYSSVNTSSNAGGSSQSSRRDSSGGRYGSTGTRVFIRNLPFSLRWQELKDKFREAGKIVRADIMKMDDGRSKGCGTVTYETTAEANRAVTLFNGYRLDGRPMEVKIDMLF
ncbi:myelin expression factor 2 [Hydra vulgaris]|uniref:Myelin expression factor 2 n=1 Tax=Hydra vulgaris TaxID=6087 RepID=A0ABM4BSQ8_HYDVU